VTRHLVIAVAALAMLAGRPVAGQTPAAEADPGVRPTRLIDRAEVRVSRVEFKQVRPVASTPTTTSNTTCGYRLRVRWSSR